ncbi:anthranilate synthase component I [Mesosutterella sp. AGMB02718]|uniref:Anthranilate synthase component 1 n=1 Tax=Mesosutterella faecium TaxID=2925194 RepID=A0ABT7IJZ1_9BURK|nr:anthranilate synthase component I [Mesosutterella sp. AGMB02718]MDL2058688.1 anthranilate synthase component I [Mesosutterella sp. AGMB02718]
MLESEFKALASEGYNRIPLVAECLADLDTPLSIYRKLADRPNSFLLESVAGGERFARYSFIGLPARRRIEVRINGEDSRARVVEDGKVIEVLDGNPLEAIEKYFHRFKVAPRPGLPRFSGGLVGYLGYDTVRLIEKKLGAPKKDDLGVPDIVLLLTEEIAVVDNISGRIYMIIHVDPNQPEAYSRGVNRLRELRQKLHRATENPYVGPGVRQAEIREFAKKDYLAAVQKAKEYIAQGEVMQVQIGQRIARKFANEPISLYRALRSLNPSPYMYYYDFGDFHIVGASPEILVRSEGEPDGTRKVYIRPIAGSRRRGLTPQQDQKFENDLKTDPKEKAEHLMLIDLARNDIGRIAEIGSVNVPDKFVVEKYSHIQHLVSEVEGRLRPGLSNFDVFKASFPAGTLTGAPKIRAMEIIDELEPVRRGIYGGAVGYFSYAGDMDMCIAIRTAIIKNKMLYAQAAAGIVADSIPENEYMETETKARAVLRAAEMVEDGLEQAI